MNSRPTPFGAVLAVAGAAATLWALLSVDRAPWAVVVCIAALACWLVRTALVFAPTRVAGVGTAPVGRAAAVAAVVAGSIAGPATDGNALVPSVVCVMVLLADTAVPPVMGGAVLAVSLGLVATGALVAGTSLPGLAAMLAAVLVGGLAGASRRQAARALRREALLAERDRELREEAARIALARDLHDVLAHSLGGLVVQLDAAEALLEAGDSSGARARLTGARDLAASGLGEARRAVAALRRPASAVTGEDAASSPVPAEEVERMLDELVAVHRGLGGAIRWERAGESAPLSAAQATSLQRALQEALSNARRHAPGAAVEASVQWRPGIVRLTVANPLTAPEAAAASGGFGLRGMAERIQALPRGGTVRVDEADGRFVLTVEEVLA